MAKKTADNPVLEGYLRDTHVVQKSRPLSLLRTVPFSLGELKVLDTYLSRINSHDPEHRTVTFTKAEYEELMGIGQAKNSILSRYTKGMLQKVVEVKMPNGYVQFILFSRAELSKDSFGVPIITLNCTEEAKKLFFGIEQLGYLRYEIRNILSLTRKSSYLLYMEILRDRYSAKWDDDAEGSVWDIPLDRLRDDVFDLKNETSYKDFRFFRQKVLAPAVKEVTEKTDVEVSYTLNKRGRTVTGVRLIYKAKPLREADQTTIDQMLDAQTAQESNYMELLRIACTPSSGKCPFTEIQLAEIAAELQVLPESMMPLPNEPDIWKRRSAYLRVCFARMEAEAERKRESGKRIGNRLAYIRAIFAKDAKDKKDALDSDASGKSFDSDEFFEAALKTGMKGGPHA